MKKNYSLAATPAGREGNARPMVFAIADKAAPVRIGLVACGARRPGDPVGGVECVREWYPPLPYPALGEVMADFGDRSSGWRDDGRFTPTV